MDHDWLIWPETLEHLNCEIHWLTIPFRMTDFFDSFIYVNIYKAPAWGYGLALGWRHVWYKASHFTQYSTVCSKAYSRVQQSQTKLTIVGLNPHRRFPCTAGRWYRKLVHIMTSSNDICHQDYCYLPTVIERFMGPTWGPPGAARTQVGPILATRTLLSGHLCLSMFIHPGLAESHPPVCLYW